MSNEANDAIDAVIRPLSAAEIVDFSALTGYAFANNTPVADREPALLQPEWSLGAFHGDRLVACAGAFPFTVRLNGVAVAAHGVTGVAVDPGYRRQGLVRQLIEGLFLRARATDVPLSLLWASMGAIYQRFGYGLGSADVSYDVEPRDVTFHEPDPTNASTSLRVRLTDPQGAMPQLERLHRQFGAARNLLLHRFPPMWQALLKPPPVYCAICYDALGDPCGSVLYRTEWDGPLGPTTQQTLTIVDFLWTSVAAYRSLWRYLASHDLVNRIRWPHAPEDDPLPLLLLEPRRLNRRTDDGLWLRLIDAEQALRKRGYRSAGSVGFTVHDALCPWNTGRYTVTSIGGGADATVQRSPVAAADGRSADLILDPNSLAMLCAGQSSATALAQAGRLQCPPAADAATLLPQLDTFFATNYRPWGPDHF